jgi:hypothetical protein
MAGNAGGKSSKAGRNSPFCKAYKASNRREHNKVRKLKKHLKVHVEDIIASEAVDRCMVKIRGYK